MPRALAHDIDTITHIRICEAHLAELRLNIEQGQIQILDSIAACESTREALRKLNNPGHTPGITLQADPP